MTRPTIALLSSPFLGAALWRGFSESARSLGWATAAITQPAAPADPRVAARAYADGLPAGEIVVLAHSNAGLYVPQLVTDNVDIVAVVLLDAVLTPRGETSAAVAPPALVEHLEALADADGRLPVWTSWWSEDQVDAVLPTPSLRDKVTQDQPKVPLSYLRGSVPVPSAWERIPTCYIAFGDTYADEFADAMRRGWDGVRLEGAEHLHMLVAPEAVMTHVDAFLAPMWEGSTDRNAASAEASPIDTRMPWSG